MGREARGERNLHDTFCGVYILNTHTDIWKNGAGGRETVHESTGATIQFCSELSVQVAACGGFDRLERLGLWTNGRRAHTAPFNLIVSVGFLHTLLISQVRRARRRSCGVSRSMIQRAPSSRPMNGTIHASSRDAPIVSAPANQAGGAGGLGACDMTLGPESPDCNAKKLRSSGPSWWGRRTPGGGLGGSSLVGSAPAPRRVIAWGLLVAVLLCFAAVSSSRHASSVMGLTGGSINRDVLCDGLPPYVVFVDAGSTGCRAHTFRVMPSAELPAFGLRTVGRKAKGTTPLASLAGKTDEEVARALLPMLSAALDKIPPRHRPETPLYVWATAGMRVVSDADQDRLWDAVARVVRQHTPFLLSTGNRAAAKHFRTIAGEEEGFFAWLAANYLSGVDLTRVGLGDPLPETIGALDVGGGSAQIVALPTSAYWSDKAVHSLAALKDLVYVRSYLGYGASHMEKRMLKEKAAAAIDGGRRAAENACGFVGKTEVVDGVTLTGTGDYRACLRDMRAQLAALQEEDGSKLRMPGELEGRSFLGMSLLYHLTHFLSVAFPNRLGAYPKSPISEFAPAAEEICAWKWETVVERLDGKDPNTPSDRLAGRCFDGALVEALLGDWGDDGGARGAGGGGNKKSGFGFARESTLVSFVENIDGAEVEWTMGAAMSLLHPAASRAGRVDDHAVEGCGAIHSVGGTRRKRAEVGAGAAGRNGVIALALTAAVLLACLGGAVLGSNGKGAGQQKWPKLALVGRESVGIVATHKRP